MRAVARSVLVVIGIAASVVAGPANVRLAAANFPYRFTIASVRPTAGQVVGVAHPVVVTFRAPVANRHAAEHAIKVESAPAMTGKFEWLDNDVVQWIPDRYWPAHSTVALSVGGMSTDFKTGPAVLGVADISDHTLTVSIDGVGVGPRPPPAPHHRPHWGEEGVMLASMGRPQFPTPVGVLPRAVQGTLGDYGFEQRRRRAHRSRGLPGPGSITPRVSLVVACSCIQLRGLSNRWDVKMSATAASA